ncbi:hypothetical protein [Variovorax sp. W2I14]|uniref:hypothetical protein n=1 Tax=Variovorax sp. W2I14 TaxID=3042290 RepID=UPI003D1DE3F6
MTEHYKALEADFSALMEEATRDSEEASRAEDSKARRRAELLRPQAQRIFIFDYKGELPRDSKQTTA